MKQKTQLSFSAQVRETKLKRVERVEESSKGTWALFGDEREREREREREERECEGIYFTVAFMVERRRLVPENSPGRFVALNT